MMKLTWVHIVLVLSAVTTLLATTAFADAGSVLTEEAMSSVSGGGVKNCSEKVFKCEEDIPCFETGNVTLCCAVVGQLEYKCIEGDLDQCQTFVQADSCFAVYYTAKTAKQTCPTSATCGLDEEEEDHMTGYSFGSCAAWDD